MLNQYSVNSFPFVSLVIPTYNEAANIEKLIRGFISTFYLNLVEIIYNPLKIQSAGLNLSLQECIGDIFLISEAHSDYAPDYIERCIEALLESKALNVGGAQRFVAKTPFQAGVVLASKSFLDSGGAKYRNPNYNGYTDTVYLECFWTKELRNASGFDVSQITNQDAELNQKLLNRNPQAIYISSGIRVWYYPRKTWKSICIQYFKYNRGRYLTSIKHTKQLQLRGKLPFLFISATLVLSLIDFIVPQLSLHTEALILSGLVFPFGESLRTTFKFRNEFTTELWRGSEDEIPSTLSLWFFCGVTLLTMPIAHFYGYGYQLVRHKIFKVNAW
ncbi:glycosyltransferase family 2 protein [Nostoc sp. JL31]|uniref:glycosyltransferase family 2 protein n=1 Tax=Nostoc sp. JL31 TaxID=2815395 RepID=UPI0025F7A5C4|nr:glycosyltransferase family 2 protein [Nostoc sp. JL31]